MGLDTFADVGEDTDREAVLVTIKDNDGKDREVINNDLYKDAMNLCGGMLSGGGASFRGKVYDEIVEQVTGESLYQERIGTKTVQEMANSLRLYADGLEGADDEVANTDTNYEVTNGEIRSLAVWFEVTAEHGLEVVGWW